MADATSASFQKQISLQDTETTITTNDGTELNASVYSEEIKIIVQLTWVAYNVLDAANDLDDDTLYVIVG